MDRQDFFENPVYKGKTIDVTKYEALGNDFLILIDLKEESVFSPELAGFLCDRHLGIGADGLIRLSATDNPSRFKMTLRNADGTFAETSGNGLRCAALAVFFEGLLVPGDEKNAEGGITGAVAEIETPTNTAQANCTFINPDNLARAMVEISMGTVIVRSVKSPIKDTVAFEVNVGNPHLVICGEDFSSFDLAAIGKEQENNYSEGVNVEFLEVGNLTNPASSAPASFPMTVWERGVGLTQACGSGSVASAVAVAEISRLSQDTPATKDPGEDDSYIISNPGGDLNVRLRPLQDDKYFAYLHGPANFIARTQVLLPYGLTETVFA